LINDTIAAISTALGEGGIGIIRISGPDAIKIGDEVFKGSKKLEDMPGYQMVYGHIVDNEVQKTIDEVIVSIMRGPKSFTTEDIIEINCHGGMVPLTSILNLVLKKGARLAEPGEFTRRAFMNGRIDLAQAESIIDVIRSKTDKGLDIAIKQLEGDLSQRVKDIRHILLELLAFIEAGIDFPDEDIEAISNQRIKDGTENALEKVNLLIRNAIAGKIYREGLSTVIIGKPNVGKSSLLNALLNEKRAIVTEIPGTTRDVIEEYLNIKGIPLKIIDTAGIRETEDIVEKIGVEKSREFFKSADLVILVFDAVSGITEDDLKIVREITNQKIIIMINKIDVSKEVELSKVENIIGKNPVIYTSIKENIGLQELEDMIYQLVSEGQVQVSDDILVSNIRHRNALDKVKVHLEGVLASVENEMPTDFMSIDLKGAWEILGEILGDTLNEDIIDQIFTSFCIGK
jgi:tRNA modification GTPase